MMQYRTKIKIHTETKEYDGVEEDVISWSTSKRYGTPAGTWQMQLSTRPDDEGKTWFDKLSPQDFVIIRLAIGDGPLITVMNGLINRVFRNTNVNPEGGAVQESIRVVGLDLGKVLTKFSVWYNPYSGDLPALVIGLAFLFEEDLIRKDIKEALQILLDLVTGRDTQFTRDAKERGGNLSIFIDLQNQGARKLSELLQFHATVGAVASDTFKLVEFEGTLWSGFKRWANEPWNELFVDNGHPDNKSDRAGDGNAQSLETDADTTYLYLRPAPFTRERFEKLVTHDISYEDIQAPFSISKGDDDTYTCYFAYPVYNTAFEPLEAKAMSTGTRIIRKGEGISVANRFGFRLLDQKSIYIALGLLDEDGKTIREQFADQEKEQKKLLDELVEFFDPNPTFLTGRVTLKLGRSKTLVKIGQRIRITENPKGRPDEIYYVVGVQNNWQFSSRFTQTLELQRGITEK